MHALRGFQRPTWNVSNQPKNGFDRCVIIHTSSTSAESDRVPKTSVDFLGERSHMSPNDALRHSLRPCCRTRASKPISDGYTLCVGSMILAIGYVHLKQFGELSMVRRALKTVRRTFKNYLVCNSC